MRVLVVTGSSGGHVFPAVSLLEALTKRDPAIKLLLVLPRRSSVQVNDYPVAHISTCVITLKGNGKTIAAAYNFIKGSYESFALLVRFKPDCVVGFGSIDSFPMVLFSWLLRIKTIIHEQNVIPGRANRVLAKIADKIAISFDGSRQHLRAQSDKIVLTGNPLRQDLRLLTKSEALGFFGFSSNKRTLLVMGGSQGSRHINNAFMEALPRLSDRRGIQVVHITGLGDNGQIENKYKELGIPARVFGFFSTMQYAYNASDLVVCRAGATTVTELIFFKLPAVLIPYPYAYTHQLYNARALAEGGAATVLNDADLEEGVLAHILDTLLLKPEIAASMKDAYKGLTLPDAAGLLAQEVLSLDQ